MKEKLLKSIPLKTGQLVNIYDESKNIAADRWQVNLTARVTFEIDEIYSEDSSDLPPISEVKQALGHTIEFEVKKQRNFIGAAEKDQVVDDILDIFTKESIPYLSNPSFSRRFLLTQYRKYNMRMPR